MMLYLAIGILCAGIAIVLSYLSRWEAVVVAYAALLIGRLSGLAHVAASAAWFWLAASALAIGISLLLPAEVRTARKGLPYFCTGALAGAALGLMLNSAAGVIIGCAAGVLLGSMAFGSVRAGRELGFPSKKYFNYVLAKGMPVIVSFSMCALLLAALAAKQPSMPH